MKRILFLLYIVVMIFNSVTIAPHPNMLVRPFNVIVSLVFLVAWLGINVYLIFNEGFKWTGYQLIAIAITGVIIYVLESLNVFTNLSGVLFVLFHSPFYGLNIFDVSYRSFAFFIGLWASIDYLLTKYFVEKVGIV